MLAVVIILIVITLVVLFLHAGRKRTVIYRKKVAPTERGYSIIDHPGVFSASRFGHSFTSGAEPDAAIYNTLAFEGGELGGGGSGDSYDSGSGFGSGFESDPGSVASGDSMDSGGTDSSSDSCGNDSSIFSGE